MKTAVPTTDPVCELIRAPFAPYFRAQFPVYIVCVGFDLAAKLYGVCSGNSVNQCQ